MENGFIGFCSPRGDSCSDQEGTDKGTVRQIALMSKTAGADIHHIGDAGYGGMAIPENIMALSIAIKGRRHTYRRMALSLRRQVSLARGRGGNL